MTRYRYFFELATVLAVMMSPHHLGAQSEPYEDSYLSRLEREIVREHNRARSDPRGYATHLRRLKEYFDGKLLKRPGEIAVITDEGVLAVNEAIRVLEATEPVERLELSAELSKAAHDHVADQGPRGGLGHFGNDGSQPWDRVERYGMWRGIVGENITYGTDTARNVVLQLIVDDGVRDRGHRQNLFNSEYRVVGVSCGEHTTFRIMCTIVYAGGFLESK